MCTESQPYPFGKNMKHTLTIIAFTFLLIAPIFGGTELSLPTDINPFFVHRTIKNAWGHETHDGVYCYAIKQKGVVGPFVDIYIVENGKVTEKVSQGSNGKYLLERIRKIGLKPFDFNNEVEKTENRLREEYIKMGRTYHPPTVLDGHLYEIIYELDDVKLKIQYSNPGDTISKLADHSENIGKLYEIYKELMLYYSERKFHFK